MVKIGFGSSDDSDDDSLVMEEKENLPKNAPVMPTPVRLIPADCYSDSLEDETTSSSGSDDSEDQFIDEERYLSNIAKSFYGRAGDLSEEFSSDISSSEEGVYVSEGRDVQNLEYQDGEMIFPPPFGEDEQESLFDQENIPQNEDPKMDYSYSIPHQLGLDPAKVQVMNSVLFREEYQDEYGINRQAVLQQDEDAGFQSAPSRSMWGDEESIVEESFLKSDPYNQSVVGGIFESSNLDKPKSDALAMLLGSSAVNNSDIIGTLPWMDASQDLNNSVSKKPRTAIQAWESRTTYDANLVFQQPPDVERDDAKIEQQKNKAEIISGTKTVMKTVECEKRMGSEKPNNMYLHLCQSQYAFRVGWKGRGSIFHCGNGRTEDRQKDDVIYQENLKRIENVKLLSQSMRSHINEFWNGGIGVLDEENQRRAIEKHISKMKKNCAQSKGSLGFGGFTLGLC